MRKLIASVFTMVTRLLAGTGIGRSMPAQKTYQFLYRRIIGKAGNLPPLLINVEGRKMYVSATSVDFAPSIVRKGWYEKFEIELFKKMIRRGMVVVDIGANIGYYTLLAAEIVGDNGKVFAFEPEPENHALLVKSIEANGYKNVIPVPKAVSNKAGTTRLFLSPVGYTCQHKIYNPEQDWDSIEIETVTLDEFFKDKQERIDVIKMDIEGAEMAALQGMSQVLEEDNDLIIFTEFIPMHLKEFGFSPEDYINQLTKHSFRLYGIDEGEKRIRPIEVGNMNQLCAGEKYSNLLCVKGKYEQILPATNLAKDGT